MHGTVMLPSTPDVLRRLIDDVLVGADVLLLAEHAEARSLLDQAARKLMEHRSRVFRADADEADGLALGALLVQLREQSGARGDHDQLLERDFATLTTLDQSCDRIVLLVGNAHRLQPGALRYLDLVCRASADLRLVLSGSPRLLEVLDQPEYAGLAARLERTPLATTPAAVAMSGLPATAMPRPAGPAATTGPLPTATAAIDAVSPPLPRPGMAAHDPAPAVDEDPIEPWEFAAAAARSAPAGSMTTPRPSRADPPRLLPAAAGLAAPTRIRPLAPRRVRTASTFRFDLQTAAALGAMAAGVAIYFAWSSQSVKPPAFFSPTPIVQPDVPAPQPMPPAPAAAPQDAQSGAQSGAQNATQSTAQSSIPTEPAPAVPSPPPVAEAKPPAAAIPSPPVAQAKPTPIPNLNPAPSVPVLMTPRPEKLGTVPIPLPPPLANTDVSPAPNEPAERLPIPPKPTRTPRERREPATRYASPSQARSNRAAYPPESQAWYDQYDTPSTPQPQVQRPWAGRQRDADPYNGWNRLDTPPPYIGTYTAGPNGVRSFRYSQ